MISKSKLAKQSKTKKKVSKIPPLVIGWNEWCALPQLSIPAIKVKVDTGAKTSAIHAFDIKSYFRAGEKYVKFKVHPMQANEDIVQLCHAKVIDERYVMSSNGHKEKRYVIETKMRIGDQQWDIELTLSNRDPLQFRMLLGREAMRQPIMINPRRQCRLKQYSKKQILELYKNE